MRDTGERRNTRKPRIEALEAEARILEAENEALSAAIAAILECGDVEICELVHHRDDDGSGNDEMATTARRWAPLRYRRLIYLDKRRRRAHLHGDHGRGYNTREKNIIY